MFDFVHRKRRIVQIIMGLAVLPFLFWGVESYRSNEGEDYVALAAGEKIQRQEFDQAMRNQQESMRATMGENFNDAMLDRPEVRSAVLEGLIQQRLLKHEASARGTRRTRFATGGDDTKHLRISGGWQVFEAALRRIAAWPGDDPANI